MIYLINAETNEIIAYDCLDFIPPIDSTITYQKYRTSADMSANKVSTFKYRVVDLEFCTEEKYQNNNEEFIDKDVKVFVEIKHSSRRL